MIKYVCKSCNIDCETSECPICHGRTNAESKIYWCNHCNVPIFDEKCDECGENAEVLTTDLRPVFPEERLLLEILIGEPLKYINSSVWNSTGNRYIVDGERLKLTITELTKKDSKIVIEQLNKYKNQNNYDYFNNNIEKFIRANRRRFNLNVSEATEFINKVSAGYELDELFISFSGGKDSTVTQDLVVKALSEPKIIHIFGDTTLEFPLTYEYLKRFRKNNGYTPMLTAKNKEKDFYNLCDTLGPPSRVMRWCCTIFKTGPITRKMSATFRDKKKIITFHGIRRSESNSRSKYDRESNSPKITKQKVMSPIIDWYDFDVWLYILATGVDFNDAYRLGYARVGCWCCPNNSNWAQYLSSIYMPEQYEEWRNFLVGFAKKIGKPDAEVYIDEGSWKARQGGNGVDFSKNAFIAFKPCAIEDNSFNYELKRSISEELYELFKPFGKISKEMGNERLGEVFVLDNENNPIIRLQGRKGSNILKVSILKLPLLKTKNIRNAKLKIECQITKYQMCIGCLGCESVCKHNAITIKKSNGSPNGGLSYTIDDIKCVRCGECINHFDGGCYMRKVLAIKRGE
ncbi:phosphoadenosine phosphosulfate reductase family protein [Clostridium sp. CF011]|uniref:phosphoadenosine phosphosulfate reductase domain-containing protein n=1 Tax=Clostridium sp. CF011 TaxID=2843318 RepID=UPI001C0D580A|nr:phosphoadenosine phosphosulfate reductase family protein [Clostridium sp. CF011]MBU3093433.1 phosphoadenosine phosphosulfate reductase family protein [Clostridium sp. CF011]WAG71278.1 phosphoadenosine phosphosulfate reductase family protein [Clostridium sp. CF011]